MFDGHDLLVYMVNDLPLGERVDNDCVRKPVDFRLNALCEPAPEYMIRLQLQKLSLAHSYQLCRFIAKNSRSVVLIQINNIFNA